MFCKYMGIDYGRRRVGVAVSDPFGEISMPHGILQVLSLSDAVQKTGALAGELEIDKLVVGLPLNMDGTKGEMAEEVDRFCAELGAQVTVPVLQWDERLSTQLVERVLLEADMSRKRRKDVRDKLAAQSILQGYLDSLSQDSLEP